MTTGCLKTQQRVVPDASVTVPTSRHNWSSSQSSAHHLLQSTQMLATTQNNNDQATTTTTRTTATQEPATPCRQFYCWSAFEWKLLLSLFTTKTQVEIFLCGVHLQFC